MQAEGSRAAVPHTAPAMRDNTVLYLIISSWTSAMTYTKLLQEIC
jgi:hypothetical protein